MAVFFLTDDLGGYITVVVIRGGEAFLFIRVVRKRVIVVYVLELDHRRGRVDDDNVPGRAGGEPHELGGIGDCVGAGFMDIDSFSGHGHIDRMMNKAQDGAGDLRARALIPVGFSAFRGHAGFSVQFEFDPPFIDAEDKDQQGGDNKYGYDQNISVYVFIAALLR